MKLSFILNDVFVRKSGEFFVSFRVSLVWLCTVVTMTMDSIRGICLLFTNFHHIHLKIELKGNEKAIMLKFWEQNYTC